MKRILYIEDDEILQGLFVAWFAKEDCAVDVCDSGESAIKKLQDKSYVVGVVIVDFEMGGINGLEFGQMVRHIDHHRCTPIVMLSSHATEHMRDDCHDVGFADCFQKGTENRVCLVECVRHLLFTEDAHPDLGPSYGLSFEAEKEEEVVRRVLYVDDSQTLRDLFLKYLEGISCEIELATDAESAMKMLEDENFRVDLLIVDYEMGSMDGIEMTKLVRGMAFHDDMPILMYSSREVSKIQEEFQNAGGDLCFKKGWQDWDIFSNCLKQFLSTGDLGRKAA